MDEASQVEQALARLLAAGPVEVYENGRWLAALSGLRFEVRHDGRKTLIHLWSEERNLVRRVLRIAEQTEGHIVDRKSTRLNSSHIQKSRMPSSA